MAKKKFYAVAKGRTTGIFEDWPSAEQQVKGYGGAKFKGFPTRQEAQQWLENPISSRGGTTAKSKPKKKSNIPAKPVPEGAVVIYTDGGAINNPGPGGYGVVVCEGDERREMSGGFRYTTNNRMELMAVIVALNSVLGERRNIVLFSDSSYVVNGVMKGWAKKWRSNNWLKSDKSEALNKDLWAELLDLLDQLKVDFRWVKGHAGNELNERCDRLAVSSARSGGLPVDIGYETGVNV